MNLVPVLFLLILPGMFCAWRWGALRTRKGRWIVGLSAAALSALAMPWQGVGFDLLKHFKMLLAAATALLFLAHFIRPLNARRLDWTLGILACLSLVNYVNYFSFHGEKTFVHLHDVAHYYLGSKYYAELGYTDLYTAMLRAESENHNNRFRVLEARELATYKRVHIRQLLQQSDEVKARFSSERWLQFRLDAEYFRERLDTHYGKVLLDHGFNPTPVWALGGGWLAKQVPAGSPGGILGLCLLDPVILLLSCLMVAWAFGLRAALLTVLFFCTVFGSSFGWVGGAFLRYPWFLGVVGGFCLLRKKYYGWAGAFFAVAVMLRVFPLFFLLPLVAKALWTATRRWPKRTQARGSGRPFRSPLSWVSARYLRFGMSFAVVCAALFLATATLPEGFGHWSAFRTNMQLHVRNIAPNVVGLTEVLAHGWNRPGMVTAEEFEALKDRRYQIHQWQQALVFLPLCLVVAWASRRRSDLAAMILAAPLLLSGLSLAAYYYAFLVLLVIYFRSDPLRLSLIFGVEALCFSLRLFEDSDGRLFVYRTLLLVWLYLFLFLPGWLPTHRLSAESSSESGAPVDESDPIAEPG